MLAIEDHYYIEKIQQNGNFLKIQKNEEQAFQLSDMQDLQKKMLETNQYPKLLPIYFEEVNDTYAIHYKIDGLKSIRKYLQEDIFTMEDYYSFFIQLINILEDSSNHMLEENSFILEEDYIFIDKHTNGIQLLYLPIKTDEDKRNDEDLKQLLLHIASEINGLEGPKFKVILNYIKDSSFNLQGIKQLLLSLHEEIQEEQEIEMTESVPVEKVKKAKRPIKPLTSKYKTYAGLFGALFLAAIWSLLPNSIVGLSIGAILTIGTIAIVLFLILKGMPDFKAERVAVEKANKKKPSASKAEKHVPMKNKEDRKASITQGNMEKEKNDNSHVEKYEMPAAEPPVEIEKTLESKMQHIEETSPLVEDQNEYEGNVDQTILLDYEEEGMDNQQKVVDNYLLVKNEGNREIELLQETVIIGRSDKNTTISTQSVGVSRTHAELVKLSDTYGVKDLGSKNGTYVNDEKITPYKIYELHDGDEILVGKEIYVYVVKE